MNIENKKFIFTEFGVSGREDKVKSSIEKFVKPYVDEIIYDNTGSLIALKKGKSKKPSNIMISAHMDTIGFIITFIDDKGFLRFSQVGGQPEHYLLGKKVIFENGTIGVIGIEKREDLKKLDKNKMFIDIGVTSKKEALKKVQIGDMCAIYAPLEITDNIITGPWMDDRIGCFILLETIEKLKKPEDNIYFVFSSQEEVGIRGATTSSYRINPDAGIAIDVTGSYDLPNGEFNGSSVLNGGAAIKIMDGYVISQKKYVDFIINIAEKNNIKYQRDILYGGGTDAHAIQLARSGAYSSGISIPTRYIHTAAEMCSLNDIQNCIDLTIKLCETKLDI